MTFCYAMCTIFSYCDELEKRPISFGLDMNIEPQKDPSKQNRLINADSSHLLDARVAPSVNPALSQKKKKICRCFQISFKRLDFLWSSFNGKQIVVEEVKLLQ